jgi:hypothetical protein
MIAVADVLLSIIDLYSLVISHILYGSSSLYVTYLSWLVRFY